MQDLAFIVAGWVVGTVVGMTGVGGGSLMTPMLIFGFGTPAHLAVGTDLLFAAFTKVGGTVNMARRRQVPWAVVARLSAGSIPAALITLAVLRAVGPAQPAVQHAMTTTLGLALLLTAAATLYKAWRGAHRPSAAGERIDATVTRHPVLVLAFGAVIGVLVTLTSVGAGAIGVTALMLLYPRLSLPRVVAADIAYAVPLTLVAGLGHAGLGSVNWHWLVLLLMGSLPGIWLGSHLIHRVPERVVRAMLSLLLAYAGGKLVTL
ncbi:MAG: sulfite exporter TauE/SafE family protein [Rhodoferax sp.]